MTGMSHCVYTHFVFFFSFAVSLQIWARHYFVLTNEKLFFTEQQEKDEEPEKEDESEVSHVTYEHII